MGAGSLLVAVGEEDRKTEEQRTRESVYIEEKYQPQVEVEKKGVQEVQTKGVLEQLETYERQEVVGAVQQQQQQQQQHNNNNNNNSYRRSEERMNSGMLSMASAP